MTENFEINRFEFLAFAEKKICICGKPEADTRKLAFK